MSDYLAETQFTPEPGGDPKAPGQMVRSNSVMPGFLQTFAIPLLAGRDFNSGDSLASPKV